MKIGLLFSGQGAQKVGMGDDLYANNAAYRQTIDQASAVLGYDLHALMSSDDQKLAQTAYVQPAILAMSTGIYAALAPELPMPAAALGLSLGEYSALTAAGVLAFDQAVAIIKDRGQYMQAAGDANPGKMVAVMTEDQDLVADCLAKLQADGRQVTIANYNTFAQLVIGGISADVDAAVAALTAAGVKRLIPLPVSGAFHTPLLADAATQLQTRLADEAFSTAVFPVYSNTTGDPFVTDDLHATLTKQVMSPTYFAQALTAMIAAGVDTLIELGPSDTLTKFAKKLVPKDVVRYAVNDCASLAAVIADIKAHSEEK